MTWPTPYEVPVPAECLPCRHCGTRCMYAEAVEDWDGRGEVIRIGSACDGGSNSLPKELADCGASVMFQTIVDGNGLPDNYEKDDFRTISFEPVASAVVEWNALQHSDEARNEYLRNTREVADEQ